MEQGRRSLGGKARLNVGVSTFIPKPHTPFQWAPLEASDQIDFKQDLLKRELRDRSIKLTWSAPDETRLEALLSRGDRRLAEVIQSAWQEGAKFDAWQDQFNLDPWRAAMEQHGLDLNHYLTRPRLEDETLPWDHISSAVRKKVLLADLQRAGAGETLPDCREDCYACGILPAFTNDRRQHPGNHWKCPEVKPAGAEAAS
jgi:hypothetical protein